MDFKIGDWVTVQNTDITFVICKIGDYAVPGITYTEPDSYFNMYWAGYISYHCRKATQEEIEKACAEMLEID